MSATLLKSIIGSKTRLKLLRIFLWNHEVEFYLRELQTLLGEDLTAIRREVAKSHDEKLLSKVTRGNRIYFQINASHSFFAPLRELFFQSENGRGNLVKILADNFSAGSRDNLDHVVLYGNGENLFTKPTWKMLFVGNMSEERLKEVVEEIEEKMKKSVRYKYFSKVDYDMQMEGEANELEEVFAGKMIEIKRSGVYL